MQLIDIVLSILLGVCSSTIFLLVLSYFARPNLVISPVIVCKLENGKRKFIIKVINKSYTSAFNIRADLTFLKYTDVPNGKILISKSINISPSELFLISKYNKNDTEASYAYRFSSYEDINNFLIDDETQFLRFQIYAQHETSSLGRVFIQNYTKRNSIIKGEFSFGNSMEVI